MSAGPYSSLAGLLAGFLVSAIVLTLSAPPSRERIRELSLPLYASAVACLSLALSSFLFAQLAGDETTSRAYLLGVAAFGMFTLAVLQLVLSLIWLFMLYSLPSEMLSGLILVFQGVLATGLLYLLILAEDVVKLKLGNDQEFPQIYLVAVVFFAWAYIAPLLVASFVRNRWYGKPGDAILRRVKLLDTSFGSPGASFRTTSTLCGVLTVATAFGYGLVAVSYLNVRSGFEGIGPGVYIAAIAAIALGLPFFLLFVQLSLPDVRPAVDPPDGQKAGG